jgi:hypothetical protein
VGVADSRPAALLGHGIETPSSHRAAPSSEPHEDPETGISNLLSTLKTPLQTENRPYQITVDDFKCLDPDPNSL